MTTQSAQQHEQANYSSASPPQSSITSLLAQIVARYERQWHVTRDMAKLEMKLSLRCVGLIVGFGLCSLLLLGFTWLGVLGGLAYALYSIGTPAWLLIIGFIVIHLLALWWLAMAMKQLSQEIGFQRSIKALSHTFHPGDDKAPGTASA